LKVLAGRPLSGSANGADKAGLVVAEGDGAAVLTGQGKLRLESIQLAGKKAGSIDDFLRGRPDFVGNKLG
jgi:methionyl-tRNA formyltransferase